MPSHISCIDIVKHLWTRLANQVFYSKRMMDTYARHAVQSFVCKTFKSHATLFPLQEYGSFCVSP